MLSMQLSSPKPNSYKGFWPDFKNEEVPQGFSGRPLRPGIPNSQSISEMDQILKWLELIPQEQHLVRRIVGARSMVYPINQRHMFSWSKIAQILHVDRRTAVRLYKYGIDLIMRELNYRAR